VRSSVVAPRARCSWSQRSNKELFELGLSRIGFLGRSLCHFTDGSVELHATEDPKRRTSIVHHAPLCYSDSQIKFSLLLFACVSITAGPPGSGGKTHKTPFGRAHRTCRASEPEHDQAGHSWRPERRESKCRWGGRIARPSCTPPRDRSCGMRAEKKRLLLVCSWQKR
jgi:hypothetical protein